MKAATKDVFKKFWTYKLAVCLFTNLVLDFDNSIAISAKSNNEMIITINKE